MNPSTQSYVDLNSAQSTFEKVSAELSQRERVSQRKEYLSLTFGVLLGLGFVASMKINIPDNIKPLPPIIALAAAAMFYQSGRYAEEAANLRHVREGLCIRPRVCPGSASEKMALP